MKKDQKVSNVKKKTQTFLVYNPASVRGKLFFSTTQYQRHKQGGCALDINMIEARACDVHDDPVQIKLELILSPFG